MTAPTFAHCLDALLLRKVLRSVLLVRLDDLTTAELLVGVGRVDDLLAVVVDDRQSGEALALAELAGPASADGVLAALVAVKLLTTTF